MAAVASHKSSTTTDEPRRGRGRPASIDNEALLEVARVVFLEQGFQATAEEVARRAGVSEGALFHRFKKKEALFRAAMKMPKEEIVGIFMQSIDAVKDLPLREGLIDLAERMLPIARIALPLMIMSWSNPQSSAPNCYDHNRSFQLQVVTRLGRYFEEQMERGLLRQLDPEVLARTFLGTLHHFTLSRMLTDGEGLGGMPESMFLRGLVDLILEGALLRPEPNAEQSRSRQRVPR
jgi:AcrR family transcriptional regulator